MWKRIDKICSVICCRIHTVWIIKLIGRKFTLVPDFYFIIRPFGFSTFFSIVIEDLDTPPLPPPPPSKDLEEFESNMCLFYLKEVTSHSSRICTSPELEQINLRLWSRSGSTGVLSKVSVFHIILVSYASLLATEICWVKGVLWLSWKLSKWPNSSTTKSMAVPLLATAKTKIFPHRQHLQTTSKFLEVL